MTNRKLSSSKPVTPTCRITSLAAAPPATVPGKPWCPNLHSVRRLTVVTATGRRLTATCSPTADVVVGVRLGLADARTGRHLGVFLITR